MRTVPFKSVYEGILRRHGMDPRGDAVSSDTGLAVSQHLNARVKRAWFLWEWPEWTVTEERAYRQIWNDSRQFYLAGPEGKPDEVFYIPNVDTHSLEGAGYYRVKGDAPANPPIGTLPTNTTYWEPFTPDTYVAYDQVCRRRIGEALEVYAANPMVTQPPPCLPHRPTEKGIEIYDAGGLLTVFIKYLIPAEQFTTAPYIATRSYQRGELVYLADTGESYQATQTALGRNPPAEPLYWRRCLFPEVLAESVKAGSYSDGLKETDTSDERDPVMIQLRGQRAAMAEAEAEDEINRQINRLQAQGQHFQYLPFGVVLPGAASALCRMPGYVLQGGGPDYGPIAPTGTGGTTLSDVCETEWGYLPPVPIPLRPAAQYGAEVVSIDGPAEPALTSLGTTGLATGTLITIVIDVSGSPQEQSWRLDPGDADAADPGQARPRDHNIVSNNKHWQRVD